jgi:hypothetical protein
MFLFSYFRYGQGEHLESHGGSTYCALASLSLLNAIPPSDDTLHWLIMRHRADEGGFEGRVNKPAADTWYPPQLTQTAIHFGLVLVWVFSAQEI